MILLLDSLLSIAIGFLEAIIFKFMWGWFIIPLGAPLINFWHSYGILLMIDFVKTWETNKDNNKNVDIEEIIVKNLTITIVCLLAWGIGALVHLGV